MYSYFRLQDYLVVIDFASLSFKFIDSQIPFLAIPLENHFTAIKEDCYPLVTFPTLWNRCKFQIYHDSSLFPLTAISQWMGLHSWKCLNEILPGVNL